MEEKTVPANEETPEKGEKTTDPHVLINIIHYDFKIFTTPLLQKIFDMIPVCGFK